ncbi:hypothetical protein E6Q11_06835 [Candidatus Dojkabacteria bacterium]|uniref:Uncharacterized protein n=1 Tax=Candidatus Dojkabacteria bacterium TaxID=2099670 RepID=A0A5C7J2L8_9BACT|nr:MAG: hypothetical protein E6Q11_06835 [Candidatus Dojkabacteria bacterium]
MARHITDLIVKDKVDDLKYLPYIQLGSIPTDSTLSPAYSTSDFKYSDKQMDQPIKDMIKKFSNSTVRFIHKPGNGVGHAYYETGSKSITVYITKSFMGSLENYTLSHNKNENRLYQSVYATLVSYYIKSLVHEFQHMYDDFRSDTRAFRTKDLDRFDSSIKNSKDYDETRNMRDYHRLNVEVNAFFMGAIDGLEFFDSDMSDDGEITYIKKPFKEVLMKFKHAYNGWAHLKNETKNKLITRLYKMYDAAESK